MILGTMQLFLSGNMHTLKAFDTGHYHLSNEVRSAASGDEISIPKEAMGFDTCLDDG
jgi:hypothetical protein